jgi:hypothetical protein
MAPLDSGGENAYARDVCRQAVEKLPFFETVVKTPGLSSSCLME